MSFECIKQFFSDMEPWKAVLPGVLLAILFSIIIGLWKILKKSKKEEVARVKKDNIDIQLITVEDILNKNFSIIV